MIDKWEDRWEWLRLSKDILGFLLAGPYLTLSSVFLSIENTYSSLPFFIGLAWKCACTVLTVEFTSVNCKIMENLKQRNLHWRCYSVWPKLQLVEIDLACFAGAIFQLCFYRGCANKKYGEAKSCYLTHVTYLHYLTLNWQKMYLQALQHFPSSSPEITQLRNSDKVFCSSCSKQLPICALPASQTVQCSDHLVEL